MTGWSKPGAANDLLRWNFQDGKWIPPGQGGDRNAAAYNLGPGMSPSVTSAQYKSIPAPSRFKSRVSMPGQSFPEETNAFNLSKETGMIFPPGIRPPVNETILSMESEPEPTVPAVPNPPQQTPEDLIRKLVGGGRTVGTGQDVPGYHDYRDYDSWLDALLQDNYGASNELDEIIRTNPDLLDFFNDPEIPLDIKRRKRMNLFKNYFGELHDAGRDLSRGWEMFPGGDFEPEPTFKYQGQRIGEFPANTVGDDLLEYAPGGVVGEDVRGLGKFSPDNWDIKGLGNLFKDRFLSNPYIQNLSDVAGKTLNAVEPFNWIPYGLIQEAVNPGSIDRMKVGQGQDGWNPVQGSLDFLRGRLGESWQQISRPGSAVDPILGALGVLGVPFEPIVAASRYGAGALSRMPDVLSGKEMDWSPPSVWKSYEENVPLPLKIATEVLTPMPPIAKLGKLGWAIDPLGKAAGKLLSKPATRKLGAIEDEGGHERPTRWNIEDLDNPDDVRNLEPGYGTGATGEGAYGSVGESIAPVGGGIRDKAIEAQAKRFRAFWEGLTPEQRQDYLTAMEKYPESAPEELARHIAGRAGLDVDVSKLRPMVEERAPLPGFWNDPNYSAAREMYAEGKSKVDMPWGGDKESLIADLKIRQAKFKELDALGKLTPDLKKRSDLLDRITAEIERGTVDDALAEEANRLLGLKTIPRNAEEAKKWAKSLADEMGSGYVTSDNDILIFPWQAIEGRILREGFDRYLTETTGGDANRRIGLFEIAKNALQGSKSTGAPRPILLPTEPGAEPRLLRSFYFDLVPFDKKKPEKGGRWVLFLDKEKKRRVEFTPRITGEDSKRLSAAIREDAKAHAIEKQWERALQYGQGSKAKKSSGFAGQADYDKWVAEETARTGVAPTRVGDMPKPSETEPTNLRFKMKSQPEPYTHASFVRAVDPVTGETVAYTPQGVEKLVSRAGGQWKPSKKKRAAIRTDTGPLTPMEDISREKWEELIAGGDVTPTRGMPGVRYFLSPEGRLGTEKTTFWERPERLRYVRGAGLGMKKNPPPPGIRLAGHRLPEQAEGWENLPELSEEQLRGAEKLPLTSIRMPEEQMSLPGWKDFKGSPIELGEALPAKYLLSTSGISRAKTWIHEMEELDARGELGGSGIRVLRAVKAKVRESEAERSTPKEMYTHPALDPDIPTPSEWIPTERETPSGAFKGVVPAIDPVMPSPKLTPMRESTDLLPVEKELGTQIVPIDVTRSPSGRMREASKRPPREVQEAQRKLDEAAKKLRPMAETPEPTVGPAVPVDPQVSKLQYQLASLEKQLTQAKTDVQRGAIASMIAKLKAKLEGPAAGIVGQYRVPALAGRGVRKAWGHREEDDDVDEES